MSTVTDSQTTVISNSNTTSVSVRSYMITASLLLVGSVLANIFLFEIGKLLGAFGSNFLLATPTGLIQMNWTLIIQSTLMYLVGALVGFFLVVRLTNINLGIIRILAILFVMGTFMPLVFVDGNALSRLFLALMHVATALIVIPVLTSSGRWNK